MHTIPTLTAGLLLGLAVPNDLTAQQPDASGEQVIQMRPCKLRRGLEPLFVFSSRKLALKGSARSGGKQFDIYLPRDKKHNYSNKPRPKRKKFATLFTSTYLAVDQNHDGKIESWESYYAEFPLRIGNQMFDVTDIQKDGSAITLKPSDSPLAGAILGGPVSEFSFPQADQKRAGQKELRPGNFAGKVLVIDRWAPS